MRQIKFRAYDKKNKKWYKPTYKAYMGELYELIIGMSGDLFIITVKGKFHQSSFDKLNDEDFELMQFTGLKDKKDKEIYEGDIVKVKEENMEGAYNTEDESIEIVELTDRGFHPFCDASPQVDIDYLWSIKSEDIEVIGNKFDNPELLET